jgi:hypothetical protein
VTAVMWIALVRIEVCDYSKVLDLPSVFQDSPMQIATTFLNKDKSVEQVARFSLFFLA